MTGQEMDLIIPVLIGTMLAYGVGMWLLGLVEKARKYDSLQEGERQLEHFT